MYIKDANGKRYEYRQKLEKYLDNNEYEFYGYIKGYEKKGCNKKLLLIDIHNEKGDFISHHNFVELSNSIKKFLNKEENKKYTQVGKKIRFIAKAYKYTNTKGQNNLGLKMYKIIEG